MTIEWNAWALTGLVAGVLAWLLAVLIYRSAPSRSLGGRAAALLFLEGAAVLTSGTGLLLLLTSPTWYRAAALAHFGVDWILLAVYLPFLAHVLNVAPLRVFRTRWMEAGLGIVGVAGAVWVFLSPERFLGPVVPSPDPRYYNLIAAPEPAWSYLAVALGMVFLCGFAASVYAWRHGQTALARRRAGAFALAIGARSLVWGAIYLLSAFAAARMTPGSLFVMLQIYGLTLVLYVALLSYGILSAQLFDIDLKVKWTIRQSTVAAAFLAVFFLVSEGAKTILSAQLGTVVGLVGAAVLVFFLAPLQRLADRVANVAVPETENSPEYEAFRKLQIYHTALEGAYSDGRVTRKDRVILDGLRRTLGIGDADAQRVEDDMRKVAQLARRDLHTQQPAGPAGT
jgi:hypothetical protein